MNYYEHHLGDYAKDTAHLSMIEHGAYRILLDAYYTREVPLPTDRRACYKLARAQSKDERAAVDYVIEEFFIVQETGIHHARCDAEIFRFKDKQAKAKRSAEARWNKQQPQSEGNANASTDAMRTHSEGSAPRARPQAPSTKHQSPDVNPIPQAAAESEPESHEPAPLAAADAITGRSIELTAMLRHRGANLQASDPRVRGWASSGVTDAQALQALEVANERRSQQANPSPVNAGLLDAIIGDVTRASAAQNRRTIHDEREAVSIALTGRKPNHERQTASAERDITGEATRVA